MKAQDFGRDDCRVGKRRISYDTLTREWRCNRCGGRLVRKYAGCWRVECGRCGGTDFIHENEAQRQKWEAWEVLEGLPPELAAELK